MAIDTSALIAIMQNEPDVLSHVITWTQMLSCLPKSIMIKPDRLCVTRPDRLCALYTPAHFCLPNENFLLMYDKYLMLRIHTYSKRWTCT